MYLISATIRNYRIHREQTIAFDRSRTLIGGPNETGKSTLIEAIHRALFLRSRTGGAVKKQMESTLHAGSPEVEVLFSAANREYQLLKRFSGTNGTTVLTEVGGKTWHGDDAEARLAALLQVEDVVGGRGAETRIAQQWAHLWVWQGKSGDDPCVHAESENAALLRRLQESGGAAAIQSAADEKVAAYFSLAVGDIFTIGGTRTKKGSDLDKAETALVEAEAEWRAASERVDRLRQAVVDFENASATIEQSKTDLELVEKQLAGVREKLSEVERLKNLQKVQETVAANATEKHEALQKTDRQMGGLRKKIAVLEESLAPKRTQVTGVEEKLAQVREQAEQAERDYTQGCDESRAALFRRDWAAAVVRLLEKKASVEQLLAKSEQVRLRQEKVQELRGELAQVPSIDARQLKNLQTLTNRVGEAEAGLNAMAAGVEVVAADGSVRIGDTFLAVGESQVVTETTEISFGESLRLRIRPGGGDRLAEARHGVAEARQKLRRALDGLNLEDLGAAAQAFARRTDLQGRLDQANSALQEMDAERMPDLLVAAQEDHAMAQAEVDRHRERLAEAVQPMDLAEAKELSTAAESLFRAAESAEADLKLGRNAAQKALRKAEEELVAIRGSIQQEAAELDRAGIELDLLRQNSGEDEARARALTEALSFKTESDHALHETRAALSELQPAQLESDRGRLERSLKETGQRQQEAKTAQTEARIALRSDGSEDPAGALSHAAARRDSARRHLDGVSRKAGAIQLLDRLFTEEKQALADHFTQPLVEKISGYLQALFGSDARATVTLKDGAFEGMKLVRSGNGAGAVAFDSLSGGTREQAAAAVRLAMAEVLAGDHGDCLPVVFDDAFAYSDPRRVQTLQRMLDLAAERGLQVIVLSCNPSDYVGLGARSVTLAGPTTTLGSTPVSQISETASPDSAAMQGATAELPVTDEQQEQLLEALRQADGSSGNQSLRETLGWDESIYQAVKEELVAAGRLIPGRGRGGSVSLNETVSNDSVQI